MKKVCLNSTRNKNKRNLKDKRTETLEELMRLKNYWKPTRSKSHSQCKN